MVATCHQPLATRPRHEHAPLRHAGRRIPSATSSATRAVAAWSLMQWHATASTTTRKVPRTGIAWTRPARRALRPSATATPETYCAYAKTPASVGCVLCLVILPAKPVPARDVPGIARRGQDQRPGQWLSRKTSHLDGDLLGSPVVRGLGLGQAPQRDEVPGAGCVKQRRNIPDPHRPAPSSRPPAQRKACALA